MSGTFNVHNISEFDLTPIFRLLLVIVLCVWKKKRNQIEVGGKWRKGKEEKEREEGIKKWNEKR
jgi:hypothetical protein